MEDIGFTGFSALIFMGINGNIKCFSDDFFVFRGEGLVADAE
jgi:hypothetical protein